MAQQFTFIIQPDSTITMRQIIPEPVIPPVAVEIVYQKCLPNQNLYEPFVDTNVTKATPILKRRISPLQAPVISAGEAVLGVVSAVVSAVPLAVSFEATVQELTARAGTEIDLMKDDLVTIDGPGQLLQNIQVLIPDGTPCNIPFPAKMGFTEADPTYCMILPIGTALKNGTHRGKTDVEYIFRFRPNTHLLAPAKTPLTVGIKLTTEFEEQITINPVYI